MARNPYGWAHQRRRRAILRPGVVCHLCGAPASELDHVPPLALHRHVEGSGCCRSLPACGDCQRQQAAELGWRGHWTTPQPVLLEEEPDPAASPGPDDPIWDAAPWLEQLRDVPASAMWPRFMTGPHPDAVGSFGTDAIRWLVDEAEITLRWWQQLVTMRQLEHDADGMLVWLDLLESTSRQSGKSTLLRSSSTWRLHQAPRFGEPQTILHTGKDLPVCREVQLPAMAWAIARDYPVRQQNGNEQITEPESGSRWIIRGKGSVYGYPGSLVLVDEAWGVAPEVVEDGLEPTMAERFSPQLVLASTAHRRATVLFPTRRAAALDELDAPSTTLIIEWSAPRGSDLDDPAAWRAASPHWSPGRQRLLEARLRRVHAGQTLDPDEDDPIESFLAQYLNVWPVRTGPRSGERLLPEGIWDQVFASVSSTGPVWVAVEDNYGQGAAVGAAARLDDDTFELDGWCCDTWETALDDAHALLESRPLGSRLVLGQAVAARVPDLRPRARGSVPPRPAPGWCCCASSPAPARWCTTTHRTSTSRSTAPGSVPYPAVGSRRSRLDDPTCSAPRYGHCAKPNIATPGQRSIDAATVAVTMAAVEERAIRPPSEPNDNDPGEAAPGTVGPPTATPGDPDGFEVIVGDPVPPPPGRGMRAAAWSGWPEEWNTPAWSSQLNVLADTAWACLDLNSSVLATMPPYLVGAAPSLPADWLNNPDPDQYASWEEFAKQLLWDYQLGEAFVLATARYANGYPARFHVVAAVDGQRRDARRRARLHDRWRGRHRRHAAHPLPDPHR